MLEQERPDPLLAIDHTDSDTDSASLYDWLQTHYPISNHEVAKLILRSVVAGFSERLEPQVIGKVSGQLDADQDNTGTPN